MKTGRIRMLEISFNGKAQDIQSIEDLSLALEEFNKCDRFETAFSRFAGSRRPDEKWFGVR
jgi:hypothetical protein